MNVIYLVDDCLTIIIVLQSESPSHLLGTFGFCKQLLVHLSWNNVLESILLKNLYNLISKKKFWKCFIYKISSIHRMHTDELLSKKLFKVQKYKF